MKLLALLAVTVSLTANSIAHAQIMPEQIPQNTQVGGSGASGYELERLGAAAGVIKTLRNTSGPTEGRSRNRTEINQIPVSGAELGGMENYYFRSSYVTLGPKGFAPLHSHAERPAFLQVISGTIHQHRSDGTSFVMGAGDFTFSSDGLVHWWNNNGAMDPTTLWIVELCTAAHKCEQEVRGGAAQLKPVTDAIGRPHADTIMSIDLAGEFPSAKGFGKRNLNLRRHDIAKGGTFDLATLGRHLTYIRVFKGKLSSVDGSTVASEGSVHYTSHGTTGVWQNNTDGVVTLFSVEFERR